MKVVAVSIFPEFFPGPMATGLLGKAVGTGALDFAVVNPRDFATDRHRSVDDIPYGGGAGMVMKVDVLAPAIARARGDGPARVVLLTPQGRPLDQATLVRWARAPEALVLVSGRYEGLDERVLALVDEQVSLGDFVLTGGEYAALAIVDGLARLLPGVLGNEASAADDSYSDGLLEHAQYTRPVEFAGQVVPAVLRGGDHHAIADVRRRDSLARTRRARPDLLARRPLDAESRAILWDVASTAPEVVVVVHASGAPEGLPLEAWARTAAAYAVARWVIVPPADADPGWVEAVRARIGALPSPALLSAPLPKGRAARARGEAARAARREAWSRARAALDVGARPALSGLWVRAAAEHEAGDPAPADVLDAARTAGRLVLELGGEGPPGVLVLPSARAVVPLNALGAAAAPAVVLDRLLGER